MRAEHLRLSKLHEQAERLAYALLARLDRTDHYSPIRNQLERLSYKACHRATRRHEAKDISTMKIALRQLDSNRLPDY